MITDDRLLQIVVDIAEVMKTARDKAPEFSAEHVKAVTEAEEIAVHADGLFPANIVSGRAPNETQEEFDYRKSAYQPVTMSAWDRIVNSTSSIFHNAVLVTDDEDTREYLTEEYPEHKSLISWFKEVITPAKASQPNAAIYVTPYILPEVETPDGIVIDDTKAIEPIGVLSDTAASIYMGPSYALLMSDEKTEVDKGGRKVKEGLVFIVFDDTYEYRIKQIGKLHDWEFEIIQYFNHNLGHVPVYKLGGIPTTGPDKSVFKNAIPHLNKAAYESSVQDGSVHRTGFPVRSYYEQDCNAEGCNNGVVIKDGERTDCSMCNGTGVVNPGPLRDVVHRRADRFNDDGENVFPGYAIISGGTDILEFLEGRLREHIESAGMSVNVDLTRKSSEPVTATEKRIDLQEKYTVLLNYANSLYDTFDAVAGDISAIRGGGEVMISRRVEFSIRGPEELVAELKEGTDLPIDAKAAILEAHTDMRFASDPTKKKTLQLKRFADALFMVPDSEIVGKLNRTVAAWQGVLHDNIDRFILEARIENPDFLDSPITEAAAALKAKALELAPQIRGTGSAEEIINGLS